MSRIITMSTHMRKESFIIRIKLNGNQFNEYSNKLKEELNYIACM